MDACAALRQFSDEIAKPEDAIDLGRAAFLIAASEYSGLDIGEQAGILDKLAAGVARRIRCDDDPLSQANTLSQYLFDAIGFHGNREDYADPENSYLNRVLERRTGLPITLSLIYLETAKRVGVPVVGIGMPGHFLVRHRDELDLFVDCFNGGILLSKNECERRMRHATSAPVHLRAEHLEPIRNRALLGRMLKNLKSIYLKRGDYARLLKVQNYVVALNPNAPEELRDRGLIHYHLDRAADALDDLRAYLAMRPPGQDSVALQRLLVQLERRLGGAPGR
jgi:regulator of sirC expression with transglutaminase-like and TPR domain